MNKSDSIKDLAAALSKAQGEMDRAPLDGVNSHFTSKYATLSALIDTMKKPLAANGLSVVQGIITEDQQTYVVTTLLHSSGQWFECGGVPLLVEKSNMQGMGSAITYAKRFGLAAALGLVGDEDDDGNAVSLPPRTQAPARQQPAPMPSHTPPPPPGDQDDARESHAGSVGDTVIRLGKYKGKRIRDVKPTEARAYFDYLRKNSADGKLGGPMAELEGLFEAHNSASTDRIPF